MTNRFTAKELKDNYEQLLNYIKDDKVTDDKNQKEKLLKLYNDLGERMSVAPASGTKTFHGCYYGGYVQHVLNVLQYTELVYKTWKHVGSTCQGYTLKELLFAALNHDLGKVGDLENDYYVVNPSKWHQDNQGKMFEWNKEINYMRVPDGSLWLLQQYNIKVDANQYIAITAHDGVFDPANNGYFTSFNVNKLPKTNMLYVLHQADLMAYRIELEKDIIWYEENNC